MKKILEMINGNKKYLALLVGVVIYSLQYWGVIDERMTQYLGTVDLMLFGGAIMHSVQKNLKLI